MFYCSYRINLVFYLICTKGAGYPVVKSLPSTGSRYHRIGSLGLANQNPPNKFSRGSSRVLRGAIKASSRLDFLTNILVNFELTLIAPRRALFKL